MKHRIIGNGEPIIILRGLCRSLEYWLGFEDELAKYFKVVMIDLPGMDDLSEITPMTTKANVDLLAQKIAELKKDIGEPPYNVFGLSLGGMAASGLAYYHPKLVKNLMIASTSSRQFRIPRINFRPLFKILLSAAIYGKSNIHKKIGKYLISNEFIKKSPWILEKWDELLSRQKITVANLFRQLAAAMTSLSPSMLRKLKVPALILAGEDDALVPFRNSVIISKAIKNSVLIVLPGFGHEVTLESASEITNIIKDFVEWQGSSDLKYKYQIIKDTPEGFQLNQLCEEHGDKLEIEILEHIENSYYKTPMYAFYVGHKPDPKLPTIALFAGFHGIEWIGASVLMNFLDHILCSMDWDEGLKETLSKINLCGIPIVNPIGRIEGTRMNGRGIDLMRNSPVIAEKASFMIGGQNLSSHLPWYRGEKLEKENLTVLKFLDDHVMPSPFKLTLDIHSGFVKTSKIWFPYASGRKLPEQEEGMINSIGKYLNKIFKYNMYMYEKQTITYSTNGDFWDYNMDRHCARSVGIYLPYTLEISSYHWMIKDFLVTWNFEHVFNPAKAKEGNVEYLKHVPLLYFFLNLARNYKKFKQKTN